MQARNDLVAILGGILPPTTEVLPYSQNITAPSGPVVMLRLDTFRQSVYAMGNWDVDAALVLVGPVTEPGVGDEALEDVLEDVLFALGSADNLLWKEAKRAVFGEPDPLYPAFEITLQITTKKAS